MKHKGRWIPLPTVASEKVFASLFQPCSSMCGDSDVGSVTGKLPRWIGSVLWIVCINRMHDAVSRTVCLLAPLLCVLDIFLVMWYVLVAVWLSWKGLISLLTTVMLASTVAMLGNLIPYALQICWHLCGCISLTKVLWCLNLRMIGSAYLLPSLQRSRQYLRCIWRW